MQRCALTNLSKSHGHHELCDSTVPKSSSSDGRLQCGLNCLTSANPSSFPSCAVNWLKLRTWSPDVSRRKNLTKSSSRTYTMQPQAESIFRARWKLTLFAVDEAFKPVRLHPSLTVPTIHESVVCMQTRKVKAVTQFVAQPAQSCASASTYFRRTQDPLRAFRAVPVLAHVERNSSARQKLNVCE